MSKQMKVLVIVAVVLSFTLLTIGFANLQDELSIGGSISFEGGTPPVPDVILLSGADVNTKLKGAISDQEEKGTTVTTIILDNYNNKGSVIEAAGYDWNSGKDVSFYTNRSIRLFTIGDTIYLLAKEDEVIEFYEDSSGIFSYLENIVTIELNAVDLSECIDLTSAFEGSSALQYVINTTPDLSKVTSVANFFKGCTSLQSVGLSGLNLSSVSTAENMFYGCVSLNSVNLSGVTFSNELVDMRGMFEGCTVLYSVNLTGIDTSNVITMQSMFKHCENLNYVTGLSDLDTSSVIHFTDTFAYCSSLTSLDLFGWDTSSATSMAGMFGGCTGLQELNLSTFNTAKVTDFSYTFSNRGSQTEDAPAADPMQLESIYVTKYWSIEACTASTSMFEGTQTIVGGWGTLYDANYVDKSYGIPDERDGANGYLTLMYMTFMHTFDESGNDYIFDTLYLKCSGTYTVQSAPSDKSAYTFLGWSPQGQVVSDECYEWVPENSNATEYFNSGYFTKEPYFFFEPGETVNVIDMLYTPYSNIDIHLYDLYAEFYIELSRNTSKDNISQYGEPNTSLQFHILDSSDQYLYYRHYNEEDEPIFGNTTINSEIDKFEQKCYPLFAEDPKHRLPMYGFDSPSLHYIHPGITLYLGPTSGSGSWSDDTYDYKASYSTYLDISQNGSLITNIGSNQNWTIQFPLSSYSVSVYGKTEVTRTRKTSSECIASGSIVMLADGTQKAVEDITLDDVLLAFNHETGLYEAQPVLFMEADGVKEYTVINLIMDDGTHLRFIGEHGLFDLEANKYLYVDGSNYKDFIGHRFAKYSADGYDTAKLVDAYLTTEITGCFEFPSTYHMNYIVDGFLSMPGGITGLFNIFEYDNELKFDTELMQADIDKYGLFTYEDFKDYMTEETFENVFPVKFLKVSIGKGLADLRRIEYIIERYLYKYGIH